MTVKYSDSFMRALFKWRGSLWKCVLKQLMFWIVAYYMIRFTIIYIMPASSRPTIKSWVRMFDNFTNRIPLQFLLGFYVVQTVSRWWAQVQAMPWPDDLISHINAMFPKNDDSSRLARKSIARYLLLTFVLGWRSISITVGNKYADLYSLVESGLLHPEEHEILSSLPNPDFYCNYPLFWMYEVIRQNLDNQFAIIKEINSIRANFRTLLNYRDICVPLVYTQTATFAVWGYFMFCLIGHQYIKFEDREVDLAFPFLTFLQFTFSVGWLNVAEDLKNPFGDDDDDIEVLKMLERHAHYIIAALQAPDRMPLDAMSNIEQSVDLQLLFRPSKPVGNDNQLPKQNRYRQSLNLKIPLLGRKVPNQL